MSLTEKKLISGAGHTGWGPRFAHSHWKAGTCYEMSSSSLQARSKENSDSCRRALDSTDFRHGQLHGTFSYPVQLGETLTESETIVTGEVYLQQSKLFTFDERNSYYNITVSNDKMTVAKSGGSGQACAFGSVGFSSGIHYWEFKIEQADVGSIFLGVAEKPGSGGSQTGRFGRWVGSGFINHRASFRSSSQTASDRLSVYGDHFHTGDAVGVLLDMNRGRLSFYLDGLKYGQHTIADLGEAFDGLTASDRVKPRTLFPVVGLSKSQDRIAITPRWLSTIGTNSHGDGGDLTLVTRAHHLLSAWNGETAQSFFSNTIDKDYPDNKCNYDSNRDSNCNSSSSSSSSSSDVISSNTNTLVANCISTNSDDGAMRATQTETSVYRLQRQCPWLLPEAWRDWQRWRAARFIRVRSRCRSSGPSVAVDSTPRACAEASIRLGMPFALFRGDRVLFSRTSGRKLDLKEEAVVLGAHKGQLW
jgi:hypothetical protein